LVVDGLQSNRGVSERVCDASSSSPFPFFVEEEVIESPFSEEAGGGGLTVTDGSIWGFSGSTPPPPGSSFLTWVMTESMMMAVLPAWGEAEEKKTPLTRATPPS